MPLPSEQCVICSADAFFEQGAGVLNARQRRELTPNAVYAQCFAPDRLEQAHDFCRDTFRAALEASARVILLDNTNVTLREYGGYMAEAEAAGYETMVVELRAPSAAKAVRISGSRGEHGVAPAVVARNFGRWEEDASALVLAPALPEQETREGGSSAGGEEEGKKEGGRK